MERTVSVKIAGQDSQHEDSFVMIFMESHIASLGEKDRTE